MRIENLIGFLKENFEKGIQMFDTPNIVGDFMVPIYKKDNILRYSEYLMKNLKELKKRLIGKGGKIYISNSLVWEYNGEKLRVVEWAERLGVTPHCLLHRKELGWDLERILTTPVKGDNNGKAKL